jgi:hypothetical protein
VDKATVYLPPKLEAALRRTALSHRVSEAELIREGIELVTAREEPKAPQLPLFHSGQPDLASHIDEALVGFGER